MARKIHYRTTIHPAPTINNTPTTKKARVKEFMGEGAWNERMARMKKTYIYNNVRFDVTLLEDEVVALSVGKGGHDVDFNIISSVYDKRGDSVARWVNDGKMLWVDKKKALDYFSVSAPLAEAQNNQELISTANIIQNFPNPKVSTKKSLITPEMDASYLDAVERGDIILLNGGMLITSGDAHRSTMHKYAHSITKKYLGERLAEVTAFIPKEDISNASNELLGKAYDKEAPQMIIDEFVSYLVESLSIDERKTIFEGDLVVDEYIETLLNEINRKNTNSKDVLFAVLPLVKENLLLQKEQYGKDREHTIVIPRVDSRRNPTFSQTSHLSGDKKSRPIEAESRVYETGRGGEGSQEEVTPRYALLITNYSPATPC